MSDLLRMLAGKWVVDRDVRVAVSSVMYPFGMAKDYMGPIELDDDLEPWLQQPGESDRQFTAFEIYKDLPPQADPESGVLGPRRLSGVYGRVDFDDAHVRKLAKKFWWVERARAWDESEESGVAGSLEFHRRVILREQLNQIAEGNQLLMKVLRSMAEDVESWKPRDLAAWWEVLRRAENDLLGMTRLGGPAQLQAVAGAKAEVTLGSIAELEAQTVELVDEMRKRGLIEASAITVGDNE
jgi:hypothetical protein